MLLSFAIPALGQKMVSPETMQAVYETIKTPYKFGKGGAFNRFAFSYDLVHWTVWKGEDPVSPSELFDNLYAHKSWVVQYKGVVYHFYCAVNKKDQRGIAVATSKDLGKSKIAF